MVVHFSLTYLPLLTCSHRLRKEVRYKHSVHSTNRHSGLIFLCPQGADLLAGETYSVTEPSLSLTTTQPWLPLLWNEVLQLWSFISDGIMRTKWDSKFKALKHSAWHIVSVPWVGREAFQQSPCELRPRAENACMRNWLEERRAECTEDCDSHEGKDSETLKRHWQLGLFCSFLLRCPHLHWLKAHARLAISAPVFVCLFHLERMLTQLRQEPASSLSPAKWKGRFETHNTGDQDYFGRWSLH